jgi:hypothetical protein
MNELKRRVLNLLIALDQFMYVLLTLGNGYPDETMSAAAWRLERAGKWQGKLFRPLIDALFRPIERDHCYQSFMSEVYRLHIPGVRDLP